MLTRSTFIFYWAAVAVAGLSVGCQETEADLTISQFDRPQDVAFVCYDDDSDEPLPISCCKTEQDQACASHAASANLYAFVTQTTSGEVAVVDVAAHEIVDQEHSIPYNTFIPVGGQPNDIAASDDGRRVYTANFETGDVSVIQVVWKSEDGKKKYSVIKDPFLSPAGSINLGGMAGKMVLVKSPERFKDRFALVTQPMLGRLVVVSLFPYNLDGTEICKNPEENPDGCVLGYLELKVDDSTLGPLEGTHPWAIAATDGQSAFVGARDAQVIWDVQIESLVKEALALDEFGPVEPAKVLNDTIPIAPYKARTISIEPMRRWLYAVEDEGGGVIAVDLQNRIPGGPQMETPRSIAVSGKVRSLALVGLEEKGDPDPLTFNGTFAVVATSMAVFGVIDVEDKNTTTPYFRPHTLRSVVDLSDPDGGVPQMEDDPTLTIDGDEIDDNKVKDYLAFNDTDEVDGGCDAGADFRPEYDHGVRFRCNPYMSKRETWSFEWEGSIGISGVGTIVNIAKNGASQPETWKLLSEDESKNFCSMELYTEGSVPGYPGDRLIITSEPTPLQGEESTCKELYKKDQTLAYRIVGVSKYRDKTEESNVNDQTEIPNVIKFEAEGNTPPLVLECFGQAVSFEVRASEQWVVKGSRSQFKRTPGSFETTTDEPDTDEKKTGECDYTEIDTDSDTDTFIRPSKMRMNVGEPFENDYLKFRLSYRGEWENGPVPIDPDEGDTDMEVEATMQFKIVNGYEEMYRNIVGTNITDIEFTPDFDVAMVDQNGEGLIFFDMLDTFSVIGGNVN